MPVLPIVRMGDPVLRTPAEPVAPERLADPAFQRFIDDMAETMRDADGVGLAAPQVGEALQLFVYEVGGPEGVEETESPDVRPDASEQDSEAPGSASEADGPAAAASSSRSGRDDLVIPLRVVVNPMLEPEGGELVYDWEGCLSIPDLRGLVPRHPAVRVRGLDRHGQPLDYVAGGFEARIVQHEFDHLNGVLFLDRMRDLRSLAFYDEWEAHMRGASDDPIALRPE